MAADPNAKCGMGMFEGRICPANCIFHEYFPAEVPSSRSNYVLIGEIYRKDYLKKLLTIYTQPDNRNQAIQNLLEEAKERTRDPIGGSTQVIADLKQQLNVDDDDDDDDGGDDGGDTP